MSVASNIKIASKYFRTGEDARYVADRIAERRDQVLPATGATRHFARAARVALSAAAFALSISSASGSEPINPPAAPHVAFLATPASGLYPGMTAQEVTRVMGEAAKEKHFVAGGIESVRLEFPGAIPTEATLSDGKVVSVTIDVFRTDKGDLPVFSRKAWPGMASSAVRHMLGEPAEILHHTFDGVDVDQWMYSRAGEAGRSRGPAPGYFALTAKGRERGPAAGGAGGHDGERSRGAQRCSKIPYRLCLQRPACLARGVRTPGQGNVRRRHLCRRRRDRVRRSGTTARRSVLPRPVIDGGRNSTMSSFNGLPVVRQREAEDAKLDWSVMWRVPCGIHQEEGRKNRSDDR
jgi:hypothetical protein